MNSMRPVNRWILWMVWGVLGASVASAGTEGREKATFAAGCFWGTEEFFRKIPGVHATAVGYAGGTGKATYDAVSEGKTGHAESLELEFDPKKVTYEELVTLFFKMHDPTTPNRQGNDVGTQYRSAIFTHSKEQERVAHRVMERIERSGAWKTKLVTEVRPAGTFYRAEEEHQKYLVKHPGGYDNHFLRPLNFDRPSDATLKKTLTPLQYDVTQKEGTEPPFKNEYWNNHREGIYVDIVSGEALFSSRDKYDSGTGWPSFKKPIRPDVVTTRKDASMLLGERTEVRSRKADSHLGHVFDDGPKPLGLRYCMNSAALRFIPVSDLAQEGYAEYLPLFKANP